MPDTVAATLLAALDPLDHPARMRKLAAETRRLTDSGSLDPVLDAFGAGDGHQRQLGLTMATIARRTDRLITALEDPLYRIRVQALFACVRTRGERERADAAVLASLDDAPAAWRRDLARAVSAAGRTGLADKLAVSHRAGLGETDAARLLCSCSAEVAARLLPGLVHLVPSWTRLGTTHPELMLDFARRELAATPTGLREGWWGAYGDGLVAAAAHHPVRVLDLLEEFPLRGGLPPVVLRRIGVLIRADEERTLRLLAAPDGRLGSRWRQLSRSICRRLTGGGWPQLELVGRAVRDDPARFARLLRDLRPSARSEFYDAVTADQETGRALLDAALLDALPHERRHAEAQRMLALGTLADRPGQRLVVVARLPWQEALPELRTAVRRADPDERAAAYPLLIGCAVAARRPAVITELLTAELGRLRNEQDPVRRAALAALAAVPAELFEGTEAVADGLFALLVDATEARDASYATLDALRVLACRILVQQASQDPDPGGLFAWALTAFEQLADVTGGLYFGRLDRTLRRGQELAVHQALEPSIRRGIQRADHRLALALTRALGRRARRMPGLQDSVAHAIWNGTSTTARYAIDLWLEDPAHRDERVARIVAWDPTAAVIARVADVLSQRRTDLLDVYLAGDKALEGRFVAKGAVWFPGLHASPRWLPRQVTAYARLLARIAEDTGAKVHARVAAIRKLGALPGEGQSRVLPYIDSANVPLAEAALGALAWSEDPAAALPILFGYADGDRARVAVYAAARAVRFARPSGAAPVLRSVALSQSAKITSRKEALRIAAQIEIPGLVDLLTGVWLAPGQHRDVKAAAVSRLAGRLDDPRVPPLLREAIGDDPAIALPLLRMHPTSLPERHREAFGELIAAACGMSDPKASGAALAAAPLWYRWTDSVGTAVCAAVTDLDRRGDRTAPPWSLAALLRAGMPMARYAAVLEDLLDADARDVEPDDAGSDPVSRDWPERDRPARRRLTSIAQSIMLAEPGDPGQRHEMLVTTAASLTGRAGFACLAAQIAAAAVDLDAEPDEVAGDALALADHTAERCDAAAAAGDHLASRVYRDEPWSPAAVLAAAAALARRTDPEAGLIAVHLVAPAGARLGWPGPYRHIVNSLRRHPAPAVAEAALDLDTGSA
ncbi:MAG TPA: hypothetical protein VGM10_10395 [Actinocrinis sp.]